jgi:DNA replication protein DnaC
MRYDNVTSENLSSQATEAINLSITENKGLFIYGGTGTGKTYILHVLAKGRCRVENFVSLLVECRDYMQKGFYYEKIQSMTDQEHFFVDDIGSEKTTDFVLEFLYLLVNERYENMKRTVFSTNLTLEEFRNRYGDRLLSRIAEMCIFLKLEGEDKRLK